MRAGFTIWVVAVLVSVGCSSGGAPAENAQEDKGKLTSNSSAVQAAAPEPEPEPEPEPDPVEELKRAARLRYPLSRLAHFAELSRDGSMWVDMGAVGARKHTNGGWRAGWSPEIRKEGAERYIEVDSKTARFFFNQTQGGFDRLVVRMKAPRKSNKVGVYLNDEGLGEIEIDSDWSEYVIEVPAKYTRDGENQLMMRFKSSATVDGRKQRAHVSGVAVLRPGAEVKGLPRQIVTRKVQMGDAMREVVAASTPQTMTWRVQLPEHAPKLALTYGAAHPGAAVTVSMMADGRQAEVLLEERVADDGAGRWHGRVVDLGAWAGEVVELSVKAGGEFEVGKQLLGWEAALYAPDKEDEAIAPTEPKRPPKNLLVYLIDTLRYDKLGVYNPESSVPTPNLDAFARDASLFDAAYDAENWTKPSTATILTGLYPDTHQTKDGSSKLPVRVTMISEHLRQEGFRTGSFIANGYVSEKFGFNQGWNYYTNYIRESKRTDAEKLVDDALRFIDRNEDDRWFVYMHTIDPHVPYSAPGPWKTKHWHGGKYRGRIRPQSTGNQLGEIKSSPEKTSAIDRQYLEALYDGEVAYNDHEFGRLVASLKERGVYDDTLIVVLVDHGEEFWDHGSVGHGHSLYDEMVHSPLFVRYPARFARGRRLPHVVSTADVVPTILETLRVKALEGVEGVSLTDVLDGASVPRPRVALSDFMYRRKALRAGRYHWQTNGMDGKLYDMATDRRQKNDLVKTHPIALAYIRGLFGMFLGAGDKTQWWVNTDKRSNAAIDADFAEIDPALQEQLEAMGYVEGATGEHSPTEDKKMMEEEDEQ